MQLRIHPISEKSSPRLYTEGEIPELDRSQIARVYTEDNFLLWGELIHPDPERYAMRRLPAGHWAHEHDENWMDWVPCANDRSLPDTVVPALQKVTGWAEDDTLLFMFNRWTTYKTTWGVFLKYWRHFLWMNDEPLLIRPETGIFVCFGSTGDIGWGRRPVSEAEAHLEWVPTESPALVGTP
jgi:hypothetical protein